MTMINLPLPCSAVLGLFVGCGRWERDSTLDNAMTIAAENGLTVDDQSDVVWFQDGSGESVGFWQPSIA